MQIDTVREKLYEKINLRVDEMLRLGLLEEVKALYGYKHLKALDTVGYKELFHFLDGTWDLEFAINEIKKNSRRYAKRQMTWLKNRYQGKKFLYDREEEMIKYIQRF